MVVEVQVVLVHGIRTSSTMWAAQRRFLRDRGVDAHAIDLPGHGTRIDETWSLEEVNRTISSAVHAASERGPVLLVAHSMGGLVSTALLGGDDPPPVSGFLATGCTAFPRGPGLALYRFLLRAFKQMPGQGLWVVNRVLDATLPTETRHDFAAGGYAFDTEDTALASLASLDLAAALPRIALPTWFVNGEWDQLRLHERQFMTLVPHVELIVIPRATHLANAMRPDAFNAAMALAIAVVGERAQAS